MRFKKIDIRNYKGIKHIVLDFDKQPKSKVLTLVGLNESGKTSILEAINLIAPPVVPEERRHELIPKSQKINFNEKVEVAALVEVEGSDNQKILEFLQNEGFEAFEPIKEFSVKAVYTFKNSTPVLGQRQYSLTINAKKKRAKKFYTLDDSGTEWKKVAAYVDLYLLPKILFYPNFLHEFPNQIVIGNEDGEIVNTFYTNIVQDILHSLDSTLDIKDHLLFRLINDKPSDREALESTLNKMSAIVTRKVFKAWGRLFKVGEKEIVITHGKRENNSTDKEDYFLEFKLKEGSDKFNISERSLGFRWFFAFLLFTEFRKHRATETSEILFLLDEPASNLHSTAQKNLIETFKELTSKSLLVYTTHSHHLINPKWLNGAYIIRNKAIDYKDEFNYDSSNTDIEAIPYKKFVSKYPNEKDYYQPILDTLDYQPGLLEKIPEIVITEGKHDYYSIKVVEKLSGVQDRFKLFPGAGADKLYDIISIYLAWGRSFIVLLDSDKAGKKAKQEYIKEYGVEVANRIFTLADINSKWDNYTMESLFAEDDQMKLIKTFDEKESVFVKSKFNTALQNLIFDDRNDILLSHTTKENFGQLFDFLIKRLEEVKAND